MTRHEVTRPIASDSAHGAEASTGHRRIQAQRAGRQGRVTTVWTIGYERLIDVRFRPQSRRPEALRARRPGLQIVDL